MPARDLQCCQLAAISWDGAADVPQSGDDAKLSALAKSFRDLRTPNTPTQQRLLRPVMRELKGVLREEFTKGIDPSGTQWQQTVRGRAALVSRKLPYAFDLAVRDGVVVGVGKSKRDLLEAHQEGHTFQSRQVAAQQSFMTFDKNGKLIRNARALNKKGEARRGVFQRFAGAHTVGERVLPERQIIPNDGDQLPALWDRAVSDGITTGIEDWHTRNSGD